MAAILRRRGIPPSPLSFHESCACGALEFTPPHTPEHRVAHKVVSRRPRPLPGSLHCIHDMIPVTPDQLGSSLDTVYGRKVPTQRPGHKRSISDPLDRAALGLAGRSGFIPTRTHQTPAARALSTPPTHRAIRSLSSSHSIPSPIGTPVSPTNHSFRFNPVIEDEYDGSAIRTADASHAVLNSTSESRVPSWGSQVAPSPGSQQSHPHPRMSIFLAPPTHEDLSHPKTPIVSVLEEGFNQCVQAVLKQDALVAAVNHTRHVRISSDQLHYLESEPRSHGGYGEVWYGRLNDGSGGFRTVAIKKIWLRSYDGPSGYGLLKALLKEAVPWYRLKHPNISSFIGYTFDNGSATLVSEWQLYGHVMNYLRQHPEANRLELIAQTAEALAYLHEQSAPLVHGDIKPENLLVSHEGIIKLTDFGISTVLHQHPASDLRTSQSFRGTLRYADPALLSDNPRPTTFTDLWAFAWLIFVIFTERRPYEHIQSEFSVTLSIMNYDVPTNSSYPDLPHSDLIWPILMATWSRSNERRWPASYIARYIRQSMEED